MPTNDTASATAPADAQAPAAMRDLLVAARDRFIADSGDAESIAAYLDDDVRASLTDDDRAWMDAEETRIVADWRASAEQRRLAQEQAERRRLNQRAYALGLYPTDNHDDGANGVAVVLIVEALQRIDATLGALVVALENHTNASRR